MISDAFVAALGNVSGGGWLVGVQELFGRLPLFPRFWIHRDFEDAGEVLHHVEVVFEQIDRAFSSRIACGLVRTRFDQQCRAFPAKKQPLWSAVSLPSLP